MTRAFRPWRWLMAGLLAFGGHLSGASAQVLDDSHWDERFGYPGLNGAVRAIAPLPNGDVVAAGTFTNAGGNPAADNIARWNGTSWHPLGNGLKGQVLDVLRMSNGDLLAAGQLLIIGIDSPGYYHSLARWDGVRWHRLPHEPGWIADDLALAPNGDVLAVFERVDSAQYQVARWDGTTWHPLNPPAYGASKVAISPTGEVLLAGGFQPCPSCSEIPVMRQTATGWEPLDQGATRRLYGVARDIAFRVSGELMMGGDFNDSTSFLPPTVYCAQWQGTGWATLAAITSTHALLPLPNGDMLVGGQPQGATQASISRWNGTTLQPYGQAFSGGIGPMVLAPNGDLLVGGSFNNAGGNVTAHHIARWDGTAWQPLADHRPQGMLARQNQQQQPVDYVQKILITPTGEAIVGGHLEEAGSTHTPNGLFRWNDTTWHDLGGMGFGYTQSMALAPNGDLLVTGLFSDSVGAAPNRILRRSGATWTSLGDPLPSAIGYPACAATANGDIFVAGENTIGRWHNGGWQPTLSGTAYSLQMTPNGDLLAAGNFEISNTRTVVARWDGTVWHALGSITGVTAAGLALAVAPNGDVIVAANLTDTLGLPAPVSRWNGRAWQAVGHFPFVYPTSLTIAPSGNIYVGEWRSHFNNWDAGAVMRWDGTTWTQVGSDLDGPVNSIALTPAGKLLVGGAFTGTLDEQRVMSLFGSYDVPDSLLTPPTSAAQPLTLHPNPAHHTVQLSGATSPTANIIDALGRTVRTSDLSPLTSNLLDLNGLAPGLYVVRCGSRTARLVVE